MGSQKSWTRLSTCIHWVAHPSKSGPFCGEKSCSESKICVSVSFLQCPSTRRIKRLFDLVPLTVLLFPVTLSSHSLLESDLPFKLVTQVFNRGFFLIVSFVKERVFRVKQLDKKSLTPEHALRASSVRALESAASPVLPCLARPVLGAQTLDLPRTDRILTHQMLLQMINFAILEHCEQRNYFERNS